MNTKLSIFRKGLILVAIPLVAQVLFMGVLLFVRADQNEAQRMALHSKQVLAQAETAYRVITEAQTHLRGYILVGSDRFARDYETQRDRAPLEFAELRELVADNSGQRQQVERMSDLASQFVVWMNETMRRMKKGEGQEVQNRITSPEAKRLLADLRQQMDDFLVEESRMDALRETKLKHSQSLSFYMLFSGVVLAVVSSGMLLIVFSRSISRRLEVLFSNARRLAADEELAPRLAGSDELSQLDRVFHEMADALHQKDQENEMFVYSVSHDLRSPLVNLQGFSKELDTILKELRSQLGRYEIPVALKERLSKMLDRDAAEAIQFIQTAVMRLSAIIDALLRLSRAGRVEYRWQTVEVQSVVQRIVYSLHDSLTRKGATVSVGELPHCWGDLTAIDQIFSNLIVNAVNYLDPDRPGIIEVGWVPETASAPGLTVYFVKDNGLGIPESLQSKVFVAFQRLHPASAPGEGIGLALVRRVMERLGGKIWLESTPGEGTTFYVALPPLPLPSGVENAKLELTASLTGERGA